MSEMPQNLKILDDCTCVKIPYDFILCADMETIFHSSKKWNNFDQVPWDNFDKNVKKSLSYLEEWSHQSRKFVKGVDTLHKSCSQFGYKNCATHYFIFSHQFNKAVSKLSNIPGLHLLSKNNIDDTSLKVTTLREEIFAGRKFREFRELW